MSTNINPIYFQTCSFPDSDDMHVEFIDEVTEQSLLEIKVSKKSDDFFLKIYNHVDDIKIPYDIFTKGIESAKSKII